jgi:hypothetical protein
LPLTGPEFAYLRGILYNVRDLSREQGHWDPVRRTDHRHLEDILAHLEEAEQEAY